MIQNFIFTDVSINSHIPCHFEALSNWNVYKCTLGICFFLYKYLSYWFKQYKLPVQYTLTLDASYTSPG